MMIFSKKSKINIFILIAVCIFAGTIYYLIERKVYIFEGLAGPATSSVLYTSEETSFDRYAKGAESRMAILLTDPEAPWLGLAHGLKSIGVPFTITTDYKWALKHRIVCVYPIISGRALTVEALKALAKFPREGGTLVGFNVLGGGLNETFGFTKALPSRKHSVVHINTDTPLTSVFTEPEEQKIILLRKDKTDIVRKNKMGTYSYSEPVVTPLAVYEDGSAAITIKHYAEGKAYAFGIDIGHLFLKGYNSIAEGMILQYVNGYDPTIDTVLRLLKNMYHTAVPYGITLHTVPFNKSLSVMITHDVDYSQSIGNALVYAQYEKNQGIRATYFIQTKYIRDWNDEIFFTEDNTNVVTQLEQWGMEVASHSVSHAVKFSDFPMGSGEEQYPDYRPVVKARLQSEEGTILGELRVSKFLLESFLGESTVLSFRPGHLSNPRSLPEALYSTGYLYSSSVTSNKSLTHLPFQLNYSRSFTQEIPIYEFSITVEDEHLPKMGERLPQAIDLAEKISRYGGIFVVLMHPDMFDHKLDFLKGIIPAVRDFSHFATVAEFGRWWSARDRIDVDVFPDGKSLDLRLIIPEKIQGITFQLPEGYQYISSIPGRVNITQSGSRLILDEVEGTVNLTLHSL